MAPKSNSEWYKKIDSLLDDTNTDLNELVSRSLDTPHNQEVIQNDNDSTMITQTMIVTRTFRMIPNMIMNLIMQIKKIR